MRAGPTAVARTSAASTPDTYTYTSQILYRCGGHAAATRRPRGGHAAATRRPRGHGRHAAVTTRPLHLPLLVLRGGSAPLRTTDGGASWAPLTSVAALAGHSLKAAWSWSGKTLAISTVIATTVVWVSKDDGDSWVDESGDYTADNGGIAQWYDNTLYVSSMGQGIVAKTFDEA